MPKDLDAELEQPIRSIAMFLESYPLEEKAIDTALFLMQGKEVRYIPVIHIQPEYEWEAKQCLAERDAKIIREQEQLRTPYSPKILGSKRSLGGNIGSIHHLLSVKEKAYYHIPSQVMTS
jgi:hypothetical protein